jgi:acetyl esterase/lipase
MRRLTSLLAGLASTLLQVDCGRQSSDPSSFTSRVIPLWQHGAPGSEARRDEPERAADWWVKNVHNPSLTGFFPPTAAANGTAIVIAPGGGFRELVFDAEGVAPAKYFANLGVAAFALKYRLAREEGSSYDLERHTGADVRRAMRLVRSHAQEWGLDPDRIGIMGWSAGGEVAAMVAYRPSPGDAGSEDPIERVDAKPSFQILVYPGSYGIPDVVPPGAPPTFVLAASDDEGPADVLSDLIRKYRQAHVPIEAHLLAQGGHGFNMGDRSVLTSIRNWPQRMADWLKDRGLLTRVTPAQ